jgi:hypothetical protein
VNITSTKTNEEVELELLQVLDKQQPVRPQVLPGMTWVVTLLLVQEELDLRSSKNFYFFILV